MEITTYIAKQTEDIFNKFGCKIDPSQIRWAKCIAYEAVTSDEIYSLYEVYTRDADAPRFFGVSEYDHGGDDLEEITNIMKRWARAENAELLAHTDVSFLFELTAPLGIHHFTSGP